MIPDEEEFDLPREGYDDYVPVVVARSRLQAEEICELLSDQDIPAVVEDDPCQIDEPAPTKIRRGVAVLVPEALLDEASEILAHQEDDDGYDAGDEEDVDEEEETECGFEEADIDLDEDLEDDDQDDEFFADEDDEEDKEF